jgi:hypothetical protein
LSHPASAPAWSKCETPHRLETNSSQLFEWAAAHRDLGKSGIILFIFSSGALDPWRLSTTTQSTSVNQFPSL